jgi:AcrR family transcriptional regulator
MMIWLRSLSAQLRMWSKETVIPTKGKPHVVKPTIRQRQAQLRREQILEQSLRLFALQGFAGTTTKQIAAAVGITEGLIFHYFPDKQSIIQTLIEEKFVVLQRDLIRLLERSSHRSAGEFLPEMLLRMAALTRRESDLVRMVIRENVLTSTDEGALSMINMVGELTQGIEHYLQGRLEARELRPDLDVASAGFALPAPIVALFIINHAFSDVQWKTRVEPLILGHFEIWYRGARA